MCQYTTVPYRGTVGTHMCNANVMYAGEGIKLPIRHLYFYKHALGVRYPRYQGVRTGDHEEESFCQKERLIGLMVMSVMTVSKDLHFWSLGLNCH